MSRLREPHRKMTADGARTENAYSHEVDVLEEIGEVNPSFYKVGVLCNAHAVGPVQLATPARRWARAPGKAAEVVVG